MKSKDLCLLIILFLFYLLAIGKAVLLYLNRLFFYNNDYNMYLNLIIQNFSACGLIIKILMVIGALTLIMGFFVIKKELSGSFRKIPVSIIVMFSALLPAFSLVNDYITGDLSFSMVLIVYGIIFTILTLKFRELPTDNPSD